MQIGDNFVYHERILLAENLKACKLFLFLYTLDLKQNRGFGDWKSDPH